MHYFQNSAIVPKHHLCHSYLNNHNKPTVISIYVKLSTNQEHIVFIFGFLTHTSYVVASELFVNMSQSLKRYNVTPFLSAVWEALSSPWPPDRHLFILQNPTPKSHPLSNSASSKLSFTFGHFKPVPLVVSRALCTACLSVPLGWGFSNKSPSTFELCLLCARPGSERTLVQVRETESDKEEAGKQMCQGSE